MPIYDFDGSAGHQIGRVYDFDGSAGHQIGTVYDFDGSAGHLIYTAETQLFPNGIAFTAGGIQAGTVSDSSLQARCGGNLTNSNCHSSAPIDCSLYNTLYFTISELVLNGNGTATVGVHPTGAGTTIGGYTKATNVTGTGVVSVDISDITGSLYVTVSCWRSTGSDSYITCTKITAG